MGSIVAARCPCGFDVRMPLGGGIRSHERLAAFPALCRACGGFQVVNAKQTPLACPGCGSADIAPYDDPSLAGEAGAKTVFAWTLAPEAGRTLALTDGAYRCPKCGEPRLRFFDEGFWD
jgi:predicted RNA-binding Zn-ribbon protein involved in translation (DUF1610 family)